jgi:oligopeptide/dipeptide ABC transporter ATP-binding protein
MSVPETFNWFFNSNSSTLNKELILEKVPMNTPILSVRNLSTKLQIGQQVCKVVDDLSFDLHLGKTLALVGESGCGKSMTALSIMRILPKPPALNSEGEIIYQGHNLLTLPEKEMRRIRGAKIAMIFQDPTSALNPVYTVGYQLVEVAELHLGLYGEEAIQRGIRALAEVGISAPAERMNDYPHQLSGGMKQRVMIAMALMCEPDILIADEPTTALDVTIQAQVLDLIRALQAKKGMAVLLITHDMGVVAEMAHDVIVMYAAQGIERGNVFEIFDHRAHPYTIGLFKSRPALNDQKGTLKAIKGTVPSVTHFPAGCRFHPRCPCVMTKCKHGPVPEFRLAESHSTKCWLYDGSEESAVRKTEDACLKS